MFEVVEVATETGAAGIAADLSELEALRAEMERHTDAYSRMLDQLSTAVAIFDRAKRLTFYNAAYRQTWSLDPAFLESQPTDGEILDRLRAKRQLPEQADFRSWKARRSPPIRRSSRSRPSGTCPTDGRCASWRAPTRRAASPISSTTRRRATRSLRRSTP